MIYREWLVMRKAVLVFLPIVGALTLLFCWAAAANHQKYHTGFISMFSTGAWFTAVFASIFGVALGNASREGARVFWVLPKSRWRSALEVVGVDVAGIAAAFVGVVLASTAINAAIVSLYPGTSMKWDFDTRLLFAVLLFPLGVYAWSALAGMIGRRVPYLGVAVFPVLMLWYVFANIGGVIGQVTRFPILANPVVAYQMQSVTANNAKAFGPLMSGLMWMTPQTGLAVMVAIAVVGCAAAIALWQRSEVLA